jgi:putative methanogenesis marker 13 metalloprotein
MNIHPRPNPIIAALYTLRDLDVDVVVIHGPSGCGFMASRMIENAGIRVVTTAITDNELIFGASENLIAVLKDIEKRFSPKSVAVIGTCASMIIGEDMKASIKRANIGCNVFSVDCHGCMGDNTKGAIRAIEAASAVGIVEKNEAERQKYLLAAATDMEKRVGMASVEYLPPSGGPTKLKVAKRIIDCLKNDERLAVIILSKKELAYRFSDLFLAVKEAKEMLGGKVLFISNLDVNKGLPRFRRYAEEIGKELKDNGIEISIVGGLDEYAVAGEDMEKVVNDFNPDLKVIVGIPHAYPTLDANDILITDQPRQLSNYLSKGYDAVGEISSHSMVMNTNKIIAMETGDTIRELLRELQ